MLVDVGHEDSFVESQSSGADGDALGSMQCGVIFVMPCVTCVPSLAVATAVVVLTGSIQSHERAVSNPASLHAQPN